MDPPFVPRVSNFEKEIRTALRVGKGYDEVVTREEANDQIPAKGKKPRASLKNWDEEF